MFACLNGAYPRGSLPVQPERLEEGRARHRSGEIGDQEFAAIVDRAVCEVVKEQEVSGLGIVSDGELRPDHRLDGVLGSWEGLGAGPTIEWPGSTELVPRPIVGGRLRFRGPTTVRAWQSAASCTSLPLKQRLPGPYTLGSLVDTRDRSRESVTLELAEGLAEELAALAAAGCPMIEIEEGPAPALGDASREAHLFRESHARMLAGMGRDGPHVSLALSGAVPALASQVLFGLDYDSYVLDLVAAPGNWHLVADAPAERGIVCGIADASSPALDAAETVIWAAALAASGGRTSERVGVAPSAGMRHLRRERARRKIEVLGEAVRVASIGPLAEIAAALVPEPGTSRFPGMRATWEAATAAGLAPR